MSVDTEDLLNELVAAHEALRVAREEILWWADEHRCCGGHEVAALETIDTILGPCSTK